VLGILFGLIALFTPGPTLAALVLLFGAYALLDGVLALIMAISGRRERGLGALLIEGVFGIGAGVVTFVYPGITAIALLAVIAMVLAQLSRSAFAPALRNWSSQCVAVGHTLWLTRGGEVLRLG
jgi:uncharacterized membrane protein HdeD (DUF308 family)